MAETWRGRLLGEAGVRRPVLIKKVLPEHAHDERFVQMFISEARISASLSHGNIAQVLDFGQVDGAYFLAMELVEGQPLHRIHQRMRKRGLEAFPIPQALFICMEVCRGLHYAHTLTDARGAPLDIVHRDISPDNVLVGYEGQVKLIDFGIAKARALRTFNTEPGVVRGKYLYFSPEQARGEPVDARTDVWAMGVLLYELLCGRLPFQGSDYVVMRQLQEGGFPLPRELRPELSLELENVICSALTLDKEARCASAGVLADALSRALYTATPRFSPRSVEWLVQSLFEEEVRKQGPKVDIPPAFLEELSGGRLAPAINTARQPPMVSAPVSARVDAETAPVGRSRETRRWPWLAAIAGLVGAGVAFSVIPSEPEAVVAPMPSTMVPTRTEASATVEQGGKAGGPVKSGPRTVAEAAAPPSPPERSPLDREFEALVEEGRRVMTGSRYKSAEASFRKALALKPGATEVKELLGIALVNGFESEGAFREAAKLLQEAVRENPESARAWLSLGMALQSIGKNAEAATAYRKYLLLQPDGASAKEVRSILGAIGK
ncbi:protein kinase [Myxococcus stipitatus]|nr:protein kinase [Myxococcus stipitatus]